jgi:hypothetical protein
MGRISLVGTFAWLLVGAMACPGLAQEPRPSTATPALSELLPPEAAPPTDPATELATWSDRGSVGSVILQSIFGKPDADSWRPMPISTFFSEGWLEPWVPSPNGSGGAPRQGWINAADGNIYRLWFFTFAEGFNYGSSNASWDPTRS